MTSRPVVTLYGRGGCHLCEDALLTLRNLAPSLRFEIEEVDIESDEALLQRYVFAIPVVSVGEMEIARAPISAVSLEEALRDVLV